jgi:hypothetical protein
VETLVECQMAPLQQKVYRALFEKNFSKLQVRKYFLSGFQGTFSAHSGNIQ